MHISYMYSMYSRSKKKQNTPTNSNTNYRREMKLIPINMDYCLLQFDPLKFFLRGSSTRSGGWMGVGALPNFDVFNVNTQI